MILKSADAYVFLQISYEASLFYASFQCDAQ